MVTARYLGDEEAVMAVSVARQAPAGPAGLEKGINRAVGTTARRTARITTGTPGLAGFLFKAVWWGALFVMVDECAGFDFLHTVLGIDVLPKSPLQKRLREQRAARRRTARARARASSGDPGQGA